MSPKPAQTREYFEPLFAFVEQELAAGNNVLIHCLAGAHRAGTAGVACLMHLCDLEPSTAITIAQTARPAINPIGDFPKLLAALDKARRGDKMRKAASGSAGGGSGASAGAGGAGASGAGGGAPAVAAAGGFGGFGASAARAAPPR